MTVEQLKKSQIDDEASNNGAGDNDVNAGGDDQNNGQGASSSSSSDDDNGSGDSVNSSSNSGSDNGQGGSRTFTQDDVTRMMTKEKQQGRNAVFNELGIDPNDTKTIEMVKAIMAAQKQDEEPPVAPSADLVEAQHRADVAEAKAEAMMLGAQPKFVDDIVTLATAKLQDSGETDFKTVIGQIKEKYPVWFGKADDNDSSSNVGRRGTGASLGSASGSGSSSSNAPSLGARLAASRTSRKPKSSYWNKK